MSPSSGMSWKFPNVPKMPAKLSLNSISRIQRHSKSYTAIKQFEINTQKQCLFRLYPTLNWFCNIGGKQLIRILFRCTLQQHPSSFSSRWAWASFCLQSPLSKSCRLAPFSKALHPSSGTGERGEKVSEDLFQQFFFTTKFEGWKIWRLHPRADRTLLGGDSEYGSSLLVRLSLKF